MNNIWFIADTHFCHANILKYCKRPFKDAQDMDLQMIEKWNEKVNPEDVVYHLGDFCFGNAQKWKSILDMLNGKIHLIKGNHDKQIPNNLFESVSDIKEIKIKDKDSPSGYQNIVLCHYAMKVWNKKHYGSWHLFGHSHGTLKGEDMSLDVGVDTNNFFPYSYDDIKVQLFRRNYD